LRCGDINGDGFINSNDLSILLSSDNYMRNHITASVALSDLNGDGMIGPADLAILLRAGNYMRGEVVIN
jgi:hypothetical protein